MCVAGYGSSKNEILELRLPPKLFANENKVSKHQHSPNFVVVIIKNTTSKCHSLLQFCVCVVFRVSVQNGISKLSTVVSQTGLFTASNMSQEPGESVSTVPRVSPDSLNKCYDFKSC